MAAVACQVVRWVADEPQPGLVEAQLTDSDGRLWSFIDKEPVFCLVLDDGREVVTVDTRRSRRARKDEPL